MQKRQAARTGADDLGEFWYWLFPAGFAFALLAYAIALKIRVYAVVDTVWTLGLGLGALLYFVCSGAASGRATAAFFVLLVWSGRLSLHLLRDRVLAGREDPRYAALASRWGSRAKFKFLFVFLAQIPLVALFLLPVTIAMGNDVPAWRFLDSLAVLIAITALLGEFLADRQLAEFRSKPGNAGKVCQEGLWRYSRHPNYFFEWLHWFAYLVFAVGAQAFWLSLIGPVMMYLFLRYITGIPFAERSSLKSRGDAYKNYQKTTNAFFPWRPQQVRNS